MQIEVEETVWVSTRNDTNKVFTGHMGYTC